MAVPIGTNSLTALARRFISPRIADNTYKSNPLFYRLYRGNKILLSGGTQIEVPLMYSRFAAGGMYTGNQVLNVNPSDTVQNAAFSWKQAYVPITFTGLDLMRMNDDLAIANLMALQFQQANMEMAEILGTSLWQNGITNPLDLDGIPAIVDDGTVAASYGGISRAANPWWKASLDKVTASLTLPTMESLRLGVTVGGRHPSIAITSNTGYSQFYGLQTSLQRFVTQPSAVDEQLAQAGFDNLVFDGIPIVVDSHCPSTNFYFLNEDYLTMYVSKLANFKMDDFIKPMNQDSMTAMITWGGNMTCSNNQLQAAFQNL